MLAATRAIEEENMRKTRFASSVAIAACLVVVAVASAGELPDTGVSGVYEVMVGTADATELVRYFNEFGFTAVSEADLSAAGAEKIYGVASALRSVRMRNGAIDSHGLVRILEWATPLGPGVGYAPPETIGQRMLVMRTEDIFRLNDVFSDLRDGGEPVLAIPPVYDDLYGMTEGTPGFFVRRVGVREMAVYQDSANHVFFQRYGYQIPGYGTIGEHAPLRTSEITHHDFVIKGDIDEVTAYYSEVLGFKPEAEEAAIDGDWQAGPKAVFGMVPGASHWYRGFVSPNNICGKLKFFVPRVPRPDRSAAQRPGELGITLHSVTVPDLSKVHDLAFVQRLEITPVTENEFGEKSFVIHGPDGASWQVIEKAESDNQPVTEFKLMTVNN
jgi:catechol 2,3-dioxygenase-like lactoylglutathione lyase family enzyme